MLNVLVNKAPSSVVVQTLIHCPIVGGILRGNGTGKSKQLAKEEPARRALTVLVWTTGASGTYLGKFFQRFLQVKEVLTRTLIIHQNAVLGCLMYQIQIAIDVDVYKLRCKYSVTKLVRR